jgi:excinuclease ABC subunit C
MRDDKSFPYILLNRDHRAPGIFKHRGARSRKGDYFGPFASAGAVGRAINSLQRAFLLRTCADSVFESRTRPCLLFQIKRCSGPCTGEVTTEGYRELVDEARDFLAGKSRAVKDRLAAEMMQAAETMEFERAARLRDRIAALSAVQGQQGINPKSVAEADVFAVVDEAGQFAIEVFFFRTYQNWGNRTYYPRADRSLSSGEVLDSFLVQFYADKPPPRLVLLSHEVENRALLAEALSERAGFAVEVAVPQRGEKRDLVEGAAANGKQALARKLAETASQEKLLAGLGAAFGMDRTPRRVEVYDNSHIMGTNAVGAMIVAGPSGFMKTQYRTFNMKDVTPGDDYGMMRQMLRRRFARLLRESRGAAADDALLSAALDDELALGDLRGEEAAEDGPADRGPGDADLPPEAEGPLAAGEAALEDPAGEEPPPLPDFDDGSPWPDLLLIDGGKGQLAAVREIMAELGVPVLYGPGAVPNGLAVVGIAKGPDRDAGRETFFVAGREPFKLHERDPALYFVQRLRDEAHRFAIGTHRAKRKKDITRSPLDEVAGIGPARKRALLHAFGTAKAIARASLADLEKVPGVNAATAKRVYDFFNEGGG